MEGYKTMLARLTDLLNALENGELNLDQLVELEEVTRKLHERSIILKYNAFKDMVAPSTKEEPIAEPQKVEVPVIEEEPEPEPEPQEEPAFDFAIFDEYEDTPGTASIDRIEEQVEEEPIAEEPIEEETPIVEEEAPAEEPVSEPEIKSEPVAEVVETPQPEVEEEPEKTAPEATVHVKGSFFDRLNMPDNSLAGRFAAGKLDTLIGAFGLNEKLRFINDLFDGSSEKFSDAIKTLDSQNNLDGARQKVEEYAHQLAWDPEEEVVMDFVNYVNRRYA